MQKNKNDESVNIITITSHFIYSVLDSPRDIQILSSETIFIVVYKATETIFML